MEIPTRTTLCLVLALASAPLFAATAAAPATGKAASAQQQRMAQCAAQNKGKQGADYKAAQSACLKTLGSAHATEAAPATAATATKLTPQQRMAQCAAQNKGKKGTDYKAAQSACLKAR